MAQGRKIWRWFYHTRRNRDMDIEAEAMPAGIMPHLPELSRP